MIRKLLLILILFPWRSGAQILPNIQEHALAMPAGVIIDGKANELNNTFQAYNKGTYLSYTLSHDNNYFYLVVQSSNLGINNKILSCGITFMVNPEGKKNEKGAPAITFPAITKSYLSDKMKVMRSMPSIVVNDDEALKVKDKSMQRQGEPAVSRRDSLIVQRHKRELSNIKEIGITNLKGIDKTLLSIYNDLDIKAKIAIDGQNRLTYELRVPLKYFNVAAQAESQVAYQLILNDSSAMYGGNIPKLVIQSDEKKTYPGIGGLDIRMADAKIGFWGTYPLTH